MTKNLQHIENDKKVLLERSEYCASFMFGVLILGSLFMVPLLWSFLLDLIDISLKTYYIFFFSFLLGVCVYTSFCWRWRYHKRIVPLSLTAIVIIIMIILSSRMDTDIGKIMCVLGVSGLPALVLCGYIGVWLKRFIRRYSNK